jgi:hypothetical protein
LYAQQGLMNPKRAYISATLIATGLAQFLLGYWLIANSAHCMSFWDIYAFFYALSLIDLFRKKQLSKDS